MNDILTEHGLEMADVEPEALALCMSGHYSKEDMQRVARISSTNKNLRKMGLPGLLFFPIDKDKNENSSSSNENIIKNILLKSKKSETKEQAIAKHMENMSKLAQETMSEDEIKAGENVGLTSTEYYAIKGNYGAVAGIDIDRNAYLKALSKCSSKAAIKLRSNKKDSEQYLNNQLINIARKRLKTIPKKVKQDSLDLDQHFGNQNIKQANLMLKTMIQPLK
jgi:hypothetical protein